MASPERSERTSLAIPTTAYGLLIDFCIEFLGLEEVPDERDLGLVVAYLLELGIKAVETETPFTREPDGLAS